MDDIILPGDPKHIVTKNEVSLKSLSASDRQRLDAALRDGWRLTPATMAVRVTRGRWIATRHLLHISTIVATAIARGGARIILTMPFRHGKSEFISVNTPIWFLEKWPHKYVMNITYGVDLATDFSIRVRDTFLDEENHHLLRTRINNKKMRAERFLTTSGGGLTAAGIGGPIVGRGADLMLIDDYVKNAEEAMSEAYHRKVWEWFKGVAYTRLEPNASLIVLATRWAQNDLIGRLLTEMPHENWTLINLPMLAEINDPLGRELDEPLWPERYPADACERIRKTLGTYWFEAQCQQNPPASMSGADIGEKLKYLAPIDLPEASQMKTIRAWDMAATEGAGDYTAGPKISRCKDDGRIIIHDMQRFQKSPHGNKVMVDTVATGDGHGVKIYMEQEPGSSGKTVIADYKKLLQGYAFEGERATGPVEVRASPFLAAIEAGNVYCVRGEWNDAFRLELNGFPDGDNDDQVSSAALGYNKLVLGIHGALTWGRDEQPANVVSLNTYRTKKRKIDPDARRRSITW